MTGKVCGFPLELIYGVRTPEGVLARDFELVKAGGVTETIITNDALRRNHPQTWMSRLVASVVARIGDVPVYQEFKKSGFKDTPAVIRQLTVADASYLLMLGHMHTYGPMLDAGKQDCPMCRRKDLYRVSMEAMKLEGMEHRDQEEFRVDLVHGWRKEVPARAEDVLPFHGKDWNTYWFRPPTVETSIRREKFATVANIINFTMLLFGDSLTRVESWAGGAKVDEMEPRFRAMNGQDLVDDLDSADRACIRKAVNAMPRLDTTVVRECSSCGEDVPISVEAGHLFPLA